MPALPRIMSTHTVHPRARQRLEALGEFVVADSTAPARLRELAAAATAVIVRAPLPDDVFEGAPRMLGAVRHGAGVDMIPVPLDDLQQILHDSAAAIARGETRAERDPQFYKAIVAATKNDVLLRFINVFYRMSCMRRQIHFKELSQSKRSHAQHLQLYTAIESKRVTPKPAERGVRR